MSRGQSHSQVEVIPSACQSCHCECGVLVEHKNGRVVSIKGDPDHPLSKGYTCPKGRAAVDLLYHPDRIIYPLKRVGDRGGGKWEKISWEEALDTMIAYRQPHRQYATGSMTTES